MIVTNQTSFDIYFGPLHLPAGVNQTLNVDDTSDTSLYLTDDTVADALNNAYLAQKITVTGEAQPFPRPTGEPQLLHGLGSPEGSVYAPPGSLMMRRDNSGSGDALYAKTTGRTFSTGWQSFGVPVTSTWSGGPPSDPLDGDTWIATNVDGTDTMRWEFQYNASSTSSSKWEFIGGPELNAHVSTKESPTSTGWVDLPTVGPSLTIPVAGDYQVLGQAAISLGATADTNFTMAAYYNGSPQLSTDSIMLRQIYDSAIMNYFFGLGFANALNAGTVLKLMYGVDTLSGSPSFASRGLFVRPIRIG